MSLPLSARRGAAICCSGLLLALASDGFAQTNYYATNGTEYAIAGSLPGDQVMPDVAINPGGGFVVWQDNVTDGSGCGISAEAVNSTLSGTLSPFRVNIQGANDQENPRVALLKNGGAVFVWQGGVETLNTRIYARFMTATNGPAGTNYVWVNPAATNDLMVNTFTNNFQANPAVAVLNDGNAVVVWSSFDQAGSNSLMDVYGQLLSPAGQKLGGEFPVNQFTPYNQFQPAVAALPNGGFVVTWVSEQQQVVGAVLPADAPISQLAAAAPSIDIYARTFNSNAVPQESEFLADTASNPCSSPAVAAAADGSFMVTWSAQDLSNSTNGLDIFARSFTGPGAGGAVVRVNTYLLNDQYSPRIAVIGGDYLIAWTSVGEDGSREGVYAQFVHEDGSLVGGEMRVNTTTVNSQMQPTVASEGAEQFLVVWTSYAGLPNGFDLYAQRYLNVAAMLPAIDSVYVYAPFTFSNGVYQPCLVVTWPPLLGISVSNYEVYVDGAAAPTGLTTSNSWTMTAANGLTTNATHCFRVTYLTTAGFQSSASPGVCGTTWSGLNWGGVPYEWMAEYFGGYYGGAYHTAGWPPASQAPPDSPGSPTILKLFLSGGVPYEPSTWLMQTLTTTPQGLFLSWPTQPGFTYQVQVTTDLHTWSNVGAPRFAAGTSDSIYVGNGSSGYYQVLLLTQ